jgi:hypothetical protein
LASYSSQVLFQPMNSSPTPMCFLQYLQYISSSTTLSMDPCWVFDSGGHGKCKQICKCKYANPILIFLQQKK